MVIEYSVKYGIYLLLKRFHPVKFDIIPIVQIIGSLFHDGAFFGGLEQSPNILTVLYKFNVVF